MVAISHPCYLDRNHWWPHACITSTKHHGDVLLHVIVRSGIFARALLTITFISVAIIVFATVNVITITISIIIGWFCDVVYWIIINVLINYIFNYHIILFLPFCVCVLLQVVQFLEFVPLCLPLPLSLPSVPSFSCLILKLVIYTYWTILHSKLKFRILLIELWLTLASAIYILYHTLRDLKTWHENNEQTRWQRAALSVSNTAEGLMTRPQSR